MSLDTDVLIIGAGMSGIGFAIQLVRNYKLTKFELYEKTDGAGGTWFSNTYPGCGCDVPSHFYSYSFALNPSWSQKFSMQPEIQSYFQNVSNQYGIQQHLNLSCTVLKAIWESATNTWLVEIRDQKTKREFQRRCKVLISAVGALSIPRECDIQGHENFKGKLFHSATWDHGLDYNDKEIVVIGNGCSATQFVPVLSESAKKITQFARQPHWLLERPNPTYSSTFKLAMRWIPGAMRLYRAKIYAELEAEFAMFDIAKGADARKKLSKASKTYILDNAPQKYLDALIPKFEVGCKRRVMDTDYLKCLHKDNVDLVWQDSVQKITPSGVLLQSGQEVSADAIVLATGFATTQLLSPIEIIGKDGISINEHWNEVSDSLPQAYYGTCVAGFPNFFVMMGPNTTTGHLSVVYTSECQINFTLRVIDPILRSLLPSRSIIDFIHSPRVTEAIEVTQTAENTENEWIQKTAKGLVWSSGCTNWYIDPKTQRNVMIYPSWQWHYWLRSIFVKKNDFAYTVFYPTSKPGRAVARSIASLSALILVAAVAQLCGRDLLKQKLAFAL